MGGLAGASGSTHGPRIVADPDSVFGSGAKSSTDSSCSLSSISSTAALAVAWRGGPGTRGPGAGDAPLPRSTRSPRGGAGAVRAGHPRPGCHTVPGRWVIVITWDGHP